MPGTVPNPTPIYRLIHVENLAACLGRGALHSPNHQPADGVGYKTIHNQEVQDKRRAAPVPCGPRGVVHDYVAFYFGPRSVMLYQLSTGWVPGYAEGQEPLIHLVSTAQAVVQAGLGCVFSDGHGLAKFTLWFDDLANLDRVDWDAAYAHTWKDTPENMDAQRRKQAEFLVHKECPWNLVSSIGVYNDAARQHVGGILAAAGLQGTLPVQVKPEWYY